MQYLNPPKGKTLDWPTDIAQNDTSYLRRYIAWKYPKAFKKDELPVASHEHLVKCLEKKVYTFGLPTKAQPEG